VAIAFTGPGALSVDNGLGLNLAGWGWGLVAVVLGCVGAAIQLSRRKKVLGEPTADAYPGDRDSAGDPATADAEPEHSVTT
jgi:hypothetical protein